MSSSKQFQFPKDFIWGTATSAHQTEGNNNNSDWWQWEQSKDYKNPTREYPLDPSGIACDSYSRYEEDFDLCVKLNNNAVRISIEWARIEPKEDEFSESEILHYRKVLESAKSRGLKTFVTLHHFSNPIWFAKKGGFANFKAPQYFAKYAKKCSEEFGDLIDKFATINEPQVYALQSYTNGTWPPNKVNPFLSLIVQLNMIRAHKSAYASIKSINKDYQVGLVKNIVWYEVETLGFLGIDKLVSNFLTFLGNRFFLVPISKNLDYIGLNYYFTNRIKWFKTQNPNDRVTDLGWWINPKGLENVLLSLKSMNIPIYITENGLADSKDALRKDFIEDMIKACAEAINNGVNLKGYFHWSLLDNYEWHHGFWPRFGLVEVDREDGLKRKPRPSFYYYAKICQTNRIGLSVYTSVP